MRINLALAATLAIGTTGCGRVGFAGLFDEEEGQVDASTQVDANTANAWNRSWSTPEAWPHGSTSYNASPSLSFDGSEMFFVSSRNDAYLGNDVYFSRFDGTSWSEPELVEELARAGSVLQVDVSGDGLTLWTTFDANAGTLADIYISTRNSREEAFSTPLLVDSPEDEVGLNSTSDDFGATPYDGSRQLKFASRRANAFGNVDLLHASRASAADEWVVDGVDTDLSTNSTDEAPWASEDGRYILFNSNREPNNTGNGSDSNFFQAEWTGAGYEIRERLDVLNAPPEFPTGSTWDEDITISGDGSMALWTSNRAGLATIFVSTR